MYNIDWQLSSLCEIFSLPFLYFLFDILYGFYNNVRKLYFSHVCRLWCDFAFSSNSFVVCVELHFLSRLRPLWPFIWWHCGFWSASACTPRVADLAEPSHSTRHISASKSMQQRRSLDYRKETTAPSLRPDQNQYCRRMYLGEVLLHDGEERASWSSMPFYLELSPTPSDIITLRFSCAPFTWRTTKCRLKLIKRSLALFAKMALS